MTGWPRWNRWTLIWCRRPRLRRTRCPALRRWQCRRRLFLHPTPADPRLSARAPEIPFRYYPAHRLSIPAGWRRRSHSQGHSHPWCSAALRASLHSGNHRGQSRDFPCRVLRRKRSPRYLEEVERQPIRCPGQGRPAHATIHCPFALEVAPHSATRATLLWNALSHCHPLAPEVR